MCSGNEIDLFGFLYVCNDDPWLLVFFHGRLVFKDNFIGVLDQIVWKKLRRKLNT